jgi:hypothetical protein
MKEMKIDIPIDYRTIKLTDSRIKKGLLAIPVSLIDLFPQDKKNITLINKDNKEEQKKFTPYSSSSHECRIGGMKNFFEIYGLKDGDEVVVIKINDDKYRLLPENIFQKTLLDAFSQLEKSVDETEFESTLTNIEMISNESRKAILQKEFVRLTNIDVMAERKKIVKGNVKSRETVPLFLRKMLLALYEGRCQLTNFTFIKKNGGPYFEIHHINSSSGNHLKNLLVVCPNIHAQFTYANVEQSFDDNGWLRAVKLNDKYFSVFQIIDTLQKNFKKEIHFI